MWRFLMLVMFSPLANADCDMASEAIVDYEKQILQAANSGELRNMAQPLACILKMQNENEGMSRYLSHSYLQPLLGGPPIPELQKDPRYQKVAKAIEDLTMRTSDAVQRSFVSEFSKGDWRFYTLFCEKGNTAFCSVFLPTEKKVSAEPPLIAAASMLRLRNAYKVLDGEQRELVGNRIKNLYREIPKSAQLKRKFIEEIYTELFPREIPLGSHFAFSI